MRYLLEAQQKQKNLPRRTFRRILFVLYLDYLSSFKISFLILSHSLLLPKYMITFVSRLPLGFRNLKQNKKNER